MLFDVEDIRSHYRKVLESKAPLYFERFDQHLLDKRPEVRALIEKAFARLVPQRVGQLLDVGCGTCFYFPILSKHADHITGVDLCVPMLEQAKQLVVEKGLTNCEVRESSALELPFPDASMDVVHSWDFLHHVPDVPKAISAIVRVLKPGGRYVALEPNLLNPSIAWYHARRRSEWRLFSQNQFSIPKVLRRHFDVKVSYDNTIISFLSSKTYWLWRSVDLLTKLPPFHLLSFRYILDAKLHGAK